jgi:hypothetical protein
MYPLRQTNKKRGRMRPEVQEDMVCTFDRSETRKETKERRRERRERKEKKREDWTWWRVYRLAQKRG